MNRSLVQSFALLFVVGAQSMLYASNSTLGGYNTFTGTGYDMYYTAGNFNSYNNSTAPAVYRTNGAVYVDGNSNTVNYSYILDVRGSSNNIANSDTIFVSGQTNAFTRVTQTHVFGRNSTITDVARSVFLGEYNSIAFAEHSFVLGDSNSITNTSMLGRATVVGVANIVSGSRNVFISGYDNNITEADGLELVGNNHTVDHGNGVIVIGNNDTAKYIHHGTILGQWNQINGATDYSNWNLIALGTSNVLNTSADSGVLGKETTMTYGTRTYAVGVSGSVTSVDDGFVAGNNNTLSKLTRAAVVGNYNSVVSTASVPLNQVYVTGYGNAISASGSGVSYGNYYLLGTGLKLTPTEKSTAVLLMGVNNKEIPLFGDSSTDASPLFILGNGNGSTGVRSNAIVVEKSGRMTLTNRNFITPTAQNLTPTQPEVLVVEGSATLKGSVTLAQRQGDIWMGDFGRTEDKGPAN